MNDDQTYDEARDMTDDTMTERYLRSLASAMGLQDPLLIRALAQDATPESLGQTGYELVRKEALSYLNMMDTTEEVAGIVINTAEGARDILALRTLVAGGSDDFMRTCIDYVVGSELASVLTIWPSSTGVKITPEVAQYALDKIIESGDEELADSLGHGLRRFLH